MFGTALYYPYMDIPNGGWLRSAILFWDQVQTIVPTCFPAPYQSSDTNICEQEGYLVPLPCDLHQNIIKELGRRVITLLNTEWDWRQFSRQTIGTSTDELNYLEEIRFLHSSKMHPDLRCEFIKINRTLAQYGNYLGEVDRRFSFHHMSVDDWVVVRGPFARLYMSALAALLAREVEVSPLTDRESYARINLRCLIDDVAESRETAARGALVSVIMKALKVDPETPIKRVLDFRRRRTDQLAQLTGIFDDLKDKIEKSSSDKELEEHARNLFFRKIKPELDKLKKELKSQAVQSVWEGLQRGITVSAPAGGVLAAATGFSGTILLGAAACITLMDVGMKSYFARSKARASSAYTYLLDVEKKFSLPRSRQAAIESAVIF